MTNPFQELYQTIYDKLKILDIDNMWFAIDVGQLHQSSPVLPLRFPAVLVKFTDVVWKQRDSSVDIGLVHVIVKYAYQFQQESQLMAGDASSQEVINCLETLFSIYQELSKITGNSFSELRLFNQYQEKCDPTQMLWINVLEFQCNIQSDAAISDPNNLYTDYDDVRNNNSFLERQEYQLMQR